MLSIKRIEPIYTLNISSLRDGFWGTQCGGSFNACFTKDIVDLLETYFQEQMVFEFGRNELDAEYNVWVVGNGVRQIANIFLYFKYDQITLPKERLEEYDQFHLRVFGESADIPNMSHREILVDLLSIKVSEEGDGSWRGEFFEDPLSYEVYFETE